MCLFAWHKCVPEGLGYINMAVAVPPLRTGLRKSMYGPRADTRT